MVTFLHRTLLGSGRYEPEVISLATSIGDAASVRLASPATWFSQPQIRRVPWHDLVFQHAGVHGSELEWQRYRPRRMLTELMREYDLLQFVVGSPPWVCTAADAERPIVLWTATTTRADRLSQRRDGSLARKTWSSVMVPLAERYERRGLQLADSIFALSEYTRESVESIVNVTDLAVAPCGVDTSHFHPSEKRSNYILCVARFWDARKNVRMLLAAYSKLKARLPAIPDLYLIGDPPSEESRIELQKLGLAENVQLLGPKQGEELAKLYREAKFFVLSSDEEGLGIVILEAMASGLAVVSTACGGPATAVKEGETGFLTPVGDADALALAMETLLKDPNLCSRMGQEGRRVAETQFSFEAAGKVFVEKYDELLTKHSEVRNPKSAFA